MIQILSKKINNYPRHHLDRFKTFVHKNENKLVNKVLNNPCKVKQPIKIKRVWLRIGRKGLHEIYYICPERIFEHELEIEAYPIIW